MAYPYPPQNQPSPMYYGTHQPPIYQQVPFQSTPFPQTQHAYPYPPPHFPANVPLAPPSSHYPPQYQPPTPQPTHPPYATSTLHIQNSGLQISQILITHSRLPHPLYTIHAPKRSHFSSEPHLLIHSSNNTPTSSIRFHSSGLTENIDLVIHGQALLLKASTWSTSSYELQSRVPGIGKLKWKNKDVLKGGDLKCVDESGNVMARFEASKWAEVQKDAKIELAPTVTPGSPLMDEIITSGIAMVEYKRRKGGGMDAGTATEVSMALIGGN
ncbi:hypothetical protein ACLMJK_000390 [Lecanora helva]